MHMSIAGHLKHIGNVHRIQELTSQGFSVTEIRDCFARGGICLKVTEGDFPLLANLPAMTKKALPKQVMRDFVCDNRPTGVAPGPV